MLRKIAKGFMIIVLISFGANVLSEMIDSNEYKEYKETVVDSSGNNIERKKLCRDLQFANNFIDNMKTELLEQHTPDYFDKPMWGGFEQGYWNGFWKNHDTCKICIANGDVPAI